KKNVFNEMFLGLNSIEGKDVLIGVKGELSVIFKIDNPILQYSADADKYEQAHSVFGQLVKVLGEDYIIQKSDIITRHNFSNKKTQADYLDKVFFKHFEGREYKEIKTYLTITLGKEIKGSFKTHDK